ncbi:MAG TPA: hypothetical protein VGB85_12635 [Nannocystis sp.]|jgi:hypothetical protein
MDDTDANKPRHREAAHRPRSPRATGRATTTPRIIPASALAPGLATIIVSLPGRTIRSRVFMVQVQPHGSVQVAFASGDMITLSPRTMVGSIERPAPPRRPRPPRLSNAS